MGTLSFLPYFHPLWLAAGTAVMLFLIAADAIRRPAPHSRWRRMVTVAAETAVSILLLLLAAHPVLTTYSPAPGQSRAIILLDASASMHQRRDTPGHTTRWQNAVLAATALAARLKVPAEIRLFSDAAHPSLPRPQELNSTPPLPGSTAIGAAIENVIASDNAATSPPLAAVILISDGAENAPSSPSAITAAQNAARNGIPVTTLTFGSAAPRSNVTITIKPDTLTLPCGTGGATTATLQNHTHTKTALSLHLRKGQQTLASHQVHLAPGSSETLSLHIPPAAKPGEQLFTCTLHDENGAALPVPPAYIHVRYLADTAPRILYMGLANSWQWRFLKQLTADTIQLSALIRLPAQTEAVASLPRDWQPARTFLTAGVPFNLTQWPQTASQLAPFDALFIECDAAATFPQETRQAITDFLYRAGGGVLFSGSPDFLPSSLRQLCPGRTFTLKRQLFPPTLPDTPFIFTEENRRLVANPPAAISPLNHYFACTATDPLSRPALLDKDGHPVLIARSTSGTGRSVWWGFPQWWQWELAASTERHRQYTAALINSVLEWLALNRVPPVQLLEPTPRTAAGHPLTLTLGVLSPNFAPAETAQVHMTASLEDTAYSATLSPDLRSPGHYTATLALPYSGLWNASFTVRRTPSEPPLQYHTSIIVTPDPGESGDDAANFTLMSTVAKLTGGRAFSNTVPPAEDIPLAKHIPYRTRHHSPTEHPVYATVIFALCVCIWHLRNRERL